MQMARESLKGKWGLAVGTFLVYCVITIIISSIPKVGSLASLLISGPMTLGLVIFSLALSRNKKAKFEQIFKGFENFSLALRAYLWMLLFILLWSLLFIIPGIIKGYSYSMIFYILADNQSMGVKKALKESMKMMQGNKMKLLSLQVRFLGWLLLCLLTFGVGLLWLVPYMQVSVAKFYDDIKDSKSKA